MAAADALTGPGDATLHEGPPAQSLVLQAGDQTRIFQNDFTVGRQGSLILSDERASSHHALFQFAHGLWYVQDLDSTNGTRINGERITEQKLRRNDILRLGNIELIYDSEHAPPGQPMPSPSERVKLSECATHGRPAGFTNASPIVKKSRGAPAKMWTLILTIVGILAVAGIGYFVWVVFVSPPTGA